MWNPLAHTWPDLQRMSVIKQRYAGHFGLLGRGMINHNYPRTSLSGRWTLRQRVLMAVGAVS